MGSTLDKEEKMIKIAICDHDQHVLSNLASIIDEYCSSIGLSEKTYTYHTGKAIVENIQENFDMLFLEINIGDVSGIDVVKEFRKHNKYAQIVFVTDCPYYQSDAFSVHAFGYILKPYRDSQIIRQIKDALFYRKSLLNKKHITIKTKSGIKSFSIEDIYYFEYEVSHVKIITKNQNYVMAETLLHILEKLSKYGFAMPHKSFIVNYLYISKFTGYEIEMTNGSKIPLSQKRAVKFKKGFCDFLKSRCLINFG